jgi:ATP-dependent exoDNAse (exonuclease V) alpha subunit
LVKKEISFLALAPTHVASRLLGKTGKTLQKALAACKHGNYSTLRNFKVIIVDEKSMASELYWNALYVLKMHTNIRFMIVGCWDQLAPVADRSASFDYENSAAINMICGGNLLRLTKCRRGDTALFDQYKCIEKMDITKFGNEDHPLALCYYNSKVWELNNKWMKHYRPANESESMVVKTTERAHKLLKCQDIIVYNGLPVMACVTRNALELFNSEQWRVRSWNEDEIVLQSDDDKRENITVATAEFAEQFRPAYAVTFHKIQGATIRVPYTIYNWNVATNRMKYVALSRGTCIKHVNIARD